MTTKKEPGTASAPDEELLRMREVAEILGCSEGHCYRLVDKGKIPSIKVVGMVRVPRSKLMLWISKNSVEAAEGSNHAA